MGASLSDYLAAEAEGASALLGIIEAESRLAAAEAAEAVAEAAGAASDRRFSTLVSEALPRLP